MEKFPLEVIACICRHLCYNDVVSLALVCRQCARAVKKYPRPLKVALIFSRWITGNGHHQSTIYRDTFLVWWLDPDTTSVSGHVQWQGQSTYGWYHISGRGCPKVSLLSPSFTQPKARCGGRNHGYSHPTCFPERMDDYVLCNVALERDAISCDDNAQLLLAILEHEQVIRERDAIGEFWEYNFWQVAYFWRMWYKIIHRGERHVSMQDMERDERMRKLP